jgi:hypothetical protein
MELEERGVVQGRPPGNVRQWEQARQGEASELRNRVGALWLKDDTVKACDTKEVPDWTRR